MKAENKLDKIQESKLKRVPDNRVISSRNLVLTHKKGESETDHAERTKKNIKAFLKKIKPETEEAKPKRKRKTAKTD
jgi:hypothetical protein